MHYVEKDSKQYPNALCGNSNKLRHTKDPNRVTCKRCLRYIKNDICKDLKYRRNFIEEKSKRLNERKKLQNTENLFIK